MGSLGIQPFQVGHPRLPSWPDADKRQTTFAVPLHCDSCVKDVSGALHKIEGMRDLLGVSQVLE